MNPQRLTAREKFSERERLCRLTWEPRGYEVLRFWLEGGYGCAEIKGENGKVLFVTQRPPK